MYDSFGIHGTIYLYKIPDEWSDEEFNYWWNPVTSPNGEVMQPARISDQEKQNRLVLPPVKNLITNSGMSQILTNFGVQTQGAMQPIAQILSMGNGAITGVTRADTTVAGDAFVATARKAPSSNSKVGFTVTITTNYAAGDAQGTWSNGGLYGGGSATTTAGTGTLESHFLFSFVKGASAYAVGYVFSLSN